MHPGIKIVIDHKRGCGWRKKGGLYMMYDGPAMACGRLPIPLTRCPCCDHGFKPTRGWTWVDAERLIRAAVKHQCDNGFCAACPVSRILLVGDVELTTAGLLWVGEVFYKTPQDYNAEANALGISRRIKSVPNGFEIGKTWVMLAHSKAIPHPLEMGKEPEFTAGIFRMFKPTHIEIVCDGTEPDELIDDYLKRGLTPVVVQRAGDDPTQGDLLKEAADAETDAE